MKVDVLQLTGDVSGSCELEEKVFCASVSEGSIYHKIRNELANARQGTADVKGRSEVSYSNRKPWRQKGTGRARAGDKKSPIWVGGGTVFGPTPRDYSYSMPVKIKRLAFRSLLSQKLSSGSLKVIDTIENVSGKTKDLCNILKNINADMSPMVLIVKNDDFLLKRAARNISWLKIFVSSRLRLVDLFYAKKIFLTKDSVEQLNVFLLNGGAQNAS